MPNKNEKKWIQYLISKGTFTKSSGQIPPSHKIHECIWYSSSCIVTSHHLQKKHKCLMKHRKIPVLELLTLKANYCNPKYFSIQNSPAENRVSTGSYFYCPSLVLCISYCYVPYKGRYIIVINHCVNFLWLWHVMYTQLFLDMSNCIHFSYGLK
jgi:hypothetical protein